MSTELPWPQLGEVLFTAGDDWHNASLGGGPEQWYGYIQGYMRAADLLVQHVIESGRDHNVLVYPITFLYRQSIELSLKRVLLNGAKALGREQEIPGHHKLEPVWRDCRALIEKLWPESPKQELEAVTEVIRQFADKDPGSFVFRYPINKEGAINLNRHEIINLAKLSKVASGVLSFLDCVLLEIDRIIEINQDNERDCWL